MKNMIKNNKKEINTLKGKTSSQC